MIGEETTLCMETQDRSWRAANEERPIRQAFFSSGRLAIEAEELRMQRGASYPIRTSNDVAPELSATLVVEAGKGHGS